MEFFAWTNSRESQKLLTEKKSKQPIPSRDGSDGKVLFYLLQLP